MDTHMPRGKVRLGFFIAGGTALFIVAIFLIGKQKNLFSPVFTLSAMFHNVSGLQVGSNIRFSGINVGTVDNISIVDGSTVRVDMLVRKSVQRFIKGDCEAGIGSAGIIGDRVLSISQGSVDAATVVDGQLIASREPTEMDAIMGNLKVTVDNAAVVSEQAAEITKKINTGNGTLSRIINDSSMGRNVKQTIINLRASSKGLSENMEAAKDSFLLRGAYKRKDKADQKVIDDAAEKKAEEQGAVQQGNNHTTGVNDNAADKKRLDRMKKRNTKKMNQ